MRRIKIAAFALSTLFLVSICSAQETLTIDNTDTHSRQDTSQIGIDGPVIDGDGTTSYIPIWRTPNYLLSSVIYQASSGNVGIGNTSPAAKLDVNGGINAATTYQISENNVVNIGSLADSNLFLGVGAGTDNVAGQGGGNTFSGTNAGYYNNSGSGNALFGTEAGFNNTTGSANTFSGYLSGSSNTTGGDNAFSGYLSGYHNTTGSNNAFFGDQTGSGNTTGSANSFVGEFAGSSNTTGNNNVYIGNLGPDAGSESSTIRIGGDVGLGYGPQTAAYIAGIYGSTSSSGVPVYINSDGLLGTQTSSLRFKEQIRDMGNSSSSLLQLRPVTFFYKPQYDDGSHAQQYGLIAEEVAKVYPEMVAYDKEGQPYTVKYQYLAPMLLNELQKEHAVVAAQQQQIEQLQQRLSRLEVLIRQPPSEQGQN